MNTNNIGEKIANLRKKRGMTQSQLAKELNIGTSTLGMYETGKRSPNPEMLNKLADYFHVSVDYLLGREIKTEAYYELSNKEKNDIALQAEKLMEGIEEKILISMGNLLLRSKRKDYLLPYKLLWKWTNVKLKRNLPLKSIVIN